MTDDEPVLVRCLSLEQCPETPLPSTQKCCHECGTAIWLSEKMMWQMAEKYPGRAPWYLCGKCVEGFGNKVEKVSDAQIWDLLGSGWSKEEVVQAIAMAMMLKGRSHREALDSIKGNVSEFMEYLRHMRDAAEQIREMGL